MSLMTPAQHILLLFSNNYSGMKMEEFYIMSTNTVKASDFFNPETQVAHLALIACPGAEELAKLIDSHLVTWAKEVGIEKDTFIVECACPRF